jgi:tetratricopeptide (TPR) repeat protein
MESPFERKMHANDLRKADKYQEALVIYTDLHQENSDQYTSAGYLHCLRKLKKFGEALPLADSLVGKFPGFDWVTTEIVWTYIEGLLNQIPEEESLSTVISVANKILHQQPNQLASNVVIMRVCKRAKDEKNWKIVHEWIQRVDPLSLDTKLMQLEDGREGWSQQGLWYLYRITALVENGQSSDAFPFLEFALEHFPKQKKLFLRLRAQANTETGKKEEAIADYENLCDVRRPDWWILKEYADLLASLDRKEEALNIMYYAAQARQDPGLMVGLFQAMGDLFYTLGNKEQAALHYQLTKLIREENGWKISAPLSEKLAELKSAGVPVPGTYNETFNECKNIWRLETEKTNNTHPDRSHDQDTLKRDVKGKISLGRPDQPFCFINLEDGESVFCYKDILPAGINHGDIVILDARPSWDQKKNKQGWKAQNVRLKNS